MRAATSCRGGSRYGVYMLQRARRPWVEVVAVAKRDFCASGEMPLVRGASHLPRLLFYAPVVKQPRPRLPVHARGVRRPPSVRRATDCGRSFLLVPYSHTLLFFGRPGTSSPYMVVPLSVVLRFVSASSLWLRRGDSAAGSGLGLRVRRLPALKPFHRGSANSCKASRCCRHLLWFTETCVVEA